MPVWLIAVIAFAAIGVIAYLALRGGKSNVTSIGGAGTGRNPQEKK